MGFFDILSSRKRKFSAALDRQGNTTPVPQGSQVETIRRTDKAGLNLSGITTGKRYQSLHSRCDYSVVH